ncbi:DUF4240 domain-containing protein [Gottfriedia sp. NPDC057948]|uniref:DUF4240 domain-containing protein n=1 Tax=Gottfriedia sp. NPDC057948 TaxID=3346287 RepID=UPI0036D9F985
MSKKGIELGDIYACELPDRRYGTIKVINRIEKSYLIYISKYIDIKLPTLENKEINEILRSNRFLYENEEALLWNDGKMHKDMKYIGNSPVSEYEKGLVSSSYGGKWHPSIANPVYYEWRWFHDRENYEREILEEQIKEREEFLNKPQKPKKMMNDDTFWSIISLFEFENAKHDEEILSPAIEKLSKTSVKDIKQFEENLACKLYLLDTKEHAKNIGENSFSEDESYFSPDLFLYIRCLVVAKGQEFYELVLNNPKKMTKNNTFEPLLSLASEAYSKRMGKEFEYISGCDYETFSNVEGWK